MEKETNLFDLCILCAQAIGRGCRRIADLCAATIRITFRQWWIVLIVIFLSLALGFYMSRAPRRWYKTEGVLLLNGPTPEMTNSALRRVAMAVEFSETQNNRVMLGLPQHITRGMRKLQTFEVIDCLADSVPDFIDYKHKVNRLDTLTVPMTNRVAIRLQVRDVNAIPTIENALCDYLNGLPQMQSAYDTYLRDLQQEATYCQTQFTKLDSLTTAFYFEQGTIPQVQYQRWSTGLIVGEREIHLFLGTIQAHLRHLKFVNQSLAMATAPVVMVDHLCFNPNAVNGTIKSLAIALFAGWLLGCLIAALIEQRKQILAWLKK